MQKTITWLLGFLAVSQLCFVSIAEAKLYTWKDRNGVIRRTYYPPPPEQVWKERQQSPQVTSSQKKSVNHVELYITSWCPYCKKAEEFFRSRGIKYAVYDIEKDKNAAARKKKLDRNGRGVPFAVINGTMISGYAPGRYAEALH